MASSGHKSVSKSNKEECPFCGEEQILQNLERHVKDNCEKAKINFKNKDERLKQFQQKRMNR